MSLTREQANAILSGNIKKEPENKQSTPESSPETAQSPAPTPNTEAQAVEQSGGPSNTDKAAEPDKADNPVEKKEPTEVKDDDRCGDKPQDSQKPSNPPKKSHEEKMNYAFVREKTKRKEAQKRVKELEAKLEEYKGLKLEHFKKDDGSQDVEAYINFRDNERNMRNEISRLQEEDRQAEIQEQVDRDRYITDHSFRTEQEKQSYLANVRDNLPSLIEELKESDPDGVILSYLGSLNQYPIVLDKMLSDPSIKNWVLRSSDKNSIQRRIEKVADDILDQYWKEPEKQPITPTAAVSQMHLAPKPAIPVTGRQVTATTGRVSSGSMKDKAYWNEWLRTHR